LLHTSLRAHTEASPAERVYTADAWTIVLRIDVMELHAFCTTHQRAREIPAILPPSQDNAVAKPDGTIFGAYRWTRNT